MAIKKGEKLLKLDLCFRLPKNFKGDLNDALELVLEYRRGKKNHKKIYTADPNKDVPTNWVCMARETDRKIFCAYSVSTYNGLIFEDETN